METKKHTTNPVTNTTNEKVSMSDRQRILSLALGDIMVFLIFATLGRGNHGEALTIWQIIITAAPFALGWFLISPFVGAYRRGLEAAPGKMLRRTLLAWVAAWPVGMLIRSLIDGRVPLPAFFPVSLIVVAGLLLIWRWPFAMNNNLKRR